MYQQETHSYAPAFTISSRARPEHWECRSRQVRVSKRPFRFVSFKQPSLGIKLRVIRFWPTFLSIERNKHGVAGRSSSSGTAEGKIHRIPRYRESRRPDSHGRSLVLVRRNAYLRRHI